MSIPAQPPTIPYEHHRVTTRDGVELAVQSVGEGPAVVIGNGIGVTRPGLDLLVDHLRQRCRVITWDYRGIGDSRIAAPRLASFTLARHAGDALSALDALGEEKAVVMGWSMGVPVGLELLRLAPERVAGYAALFGSAGPPFRAAAPRPVSDAVELVFRASRHYSAPAQRLLDISVLWPQVGWTICSGIGFVGKRAQPDLFYGACSSTSKADKRAYFSTMKHLLAHDARDVLADVDCPALVVAGEGDWVTPPHAAEEMASAIPHAKLVVLPNTSHFGIMEHGPELWGPVDGLIDRATS